MYNRQNKQGYSLRKPYVPPARRQFILLRLILVMTLGTGLLLFVVSPTDAETHSKDESIYYYQQGRLSADRMQGQGTLSDAEIEQAMRGFEASLKKQASPYSEEVLQQAESRHQEKRIQQREIQAQQNLQAGEQYLAKLETQADYVVLDQGLAYTILSEGQGDIPGANAQVRLNYRLSRLDGTELDRSATPTWMSIQSVLPGWRMALRRMPAGSRWRLVVPAHLAYGERGAGIQIGPQETLIFELSLLEVKN